MKLFSRRNFVAMLASFVLVGTAHTAIAGPRVSVKTNMGEFVMELNPSKAPKTVSNFLKYVKAGHYSGTVFHRVIPGFMIQGGGFDKDMKQKPTRAPIENEANSEGLLNETYSVAMARTAVPESATSQFFVNVENNSVLDYPGADGWGYCVFGKVIEGKDIIDKIKMVDVTTKGEHENVPVDPVVIESISIVK